MKIEKSRNRKFQKYRNSKMQKSINPKMRKSKMQSIKYSVDNAGIENPKTIVN